MKKNIILILLVIFACWACKKDPLFDPIVSNYKYLNATDSTNSMTTRPFPENVINVQGVVLFEFNDFDGNVYHAVQIGNQIWSQENLTTTHYNDGTPIPCVQSTSEWNALNKGAYCHYNNDASNSKTYGLLYNFYAVNSKKLVPEGWHAATYEEWNTLIVGIGNRPLPMIGVVGPLVDERNWTGPFTTCLGNVIGCSNSTLFTALPNGYRDQFNACPEFDCLGYQASWWASNFDHGIIIYLDQTFGIFSLKDRPIQAGSGIRLVKDAN